MTITKLVFASEEKKVLGRGQKMKFKEIVRNRRCTVFRYQGTEAELCRQKVVILLRTNNVSTSYIASSACKITSPANFLYVLGTADRKVRKDK